MNQLNTDNPTYNDNEMVIERISFMLDTPPQHKLHKLLQIFNACEHSCILMIMVGCKMSKKEYDFMAMAHPISSAI